MRTVSGAKLTIVSEMEEIGESVFERSEFRFASGYEQGGFLSRPYNRFLRRSEVFRLSNLNTEASEHTQIHTRP